MRLGRIQRVTAETEINGTYELDGSGLYSIDTGCGFLDHMLELFTRHGRYDITLSCRGDVNVDYHHTVEDVGIVLGRACSEALADRVGIKRYGSFILPMDESLVITAIDIGGRVGFYSDLLFPSEKIGDFDTELIDEFFLAFARALGAAIHVHMVRGKNSHHIAEATFKGFARALAQAVEVDMDASDQIPSTKGTIL